MSVRHVARKRSGRSLTSPTQVMRRELMQDHQPPCQHPNFEELKHDLMQVHILGRGMSDLLRQAKNCSECAPKVDLLSQQIRHSH